MIRNIITQTDKPMTTQQYSTTDRLLAAVVQNQNTIIAALTELAKKVDGFTVHDYVTDAMSEVESLADELSPEKPPKKKSVRKSGGKRKSPKKKSAPAPTTIPTAASPPKGVPMTAPSALPPPPAGASPAIPTPVVAASAPPSAAGMTDKQAEQVRVVDLVISLSDQGMDMIEQRNTLCSLHNMDPKTYDFVLYNLDKFRKARNKPNAAPTPATSPAKSTGSTVDGCPIKFVANKAPTYKPRKSGDSVKPVQLWVGDASDLDQVSFMGVPIWDTMLTLMGDNEQGTFGFKNTKMWATLLPEQGTVTAGDTVIQAENCIAVAPLTFIKKLEKASKQEIPGARVSVGTDAVEPIVVDDYTVQVGGLTLKLVAH